MSTKIEKKREREKKMVSQMIQLYCKKQHHSKDGLCPECARAGCLCQNAQREMPVYGDQDLLFQLQGALL